MSRTIIQTTNAGWFINTEDPDGPRVRKRDGDTVISLEEFQASRGQSPSQKRAATGAKGQHTRRAERKLEQTAAETRTPSVTSETGKTLRGKTTTIKCQFQGEDGESGPACGKERIVKVQDAKQVKYCVPHQKAHRRKLKREKLRAKRQAEQGTVTA